MAAWLKHEIKIMITYDHGSVRLLGIPLFTLAIGVAFVAALAGLAFGALRWRRSTGKILVITSAFVLLLDVYKRQGLTTP